MLHFLTQLKFKNKNQPELLELPTLNYMELNNQGVK